MSYDRFTVLDIAPRFLSEQQLDACYIEARRLADAEHYSHLKVVPDIIARSLRKEAGIIVPMIGEVAIPAHDVDGEPCSGSGLAIGNGDCGFCPAFFCADCASPNAQTFNDYDDALCPNCAEERESRVLATTE